MLCLAIFQAWRARNLSTEFAESRHIASALLIAFIVAILAVPVLYITYEDPNADTFIDAILVSVVSGTILCFIFIPKIIFHTKLTKLSPTNSSRFSGMSITSSNHSRVSEWGERILTAKPQEQLASENKSLERELTLMRKRAERLNRHNIELQQRLRKLTGDENKDVGSYTDAAESEETIDFFKAGDDGSVVDRFDDSLSFFKTILSEANSELSDTRTIKNSNCESTREDPLPRESSSGNMQDGSRNSIRKVGFSSPPTKL
jgi:hypothetical protein